MRESIILHHYENSPYAEKIRLMFGLADMPWESLLSPVWPPRPNVDPLSGGYRRIPIAQIGADIFCDSSLLAAEIARMAELPALDPANLDGEALRLARMAEREGFFSAIRSLPTRKLLGTMLRSFGPTGAWRFVKDRTALMQNAPARPPAPEQARKIMHRLFTELEEHLDTGPWIGGEAASLADFAVYHPLWLHLSCGGSLPAGAERTQRWFSAVAAIGHGRRQEISQAQAFAVARDSLPRALPESPGGEGPAIGSQVEVAPDDYGVVPVAGALVALTADRIILARQDEDFGTLHVHFPREGYVIESI
jgi:glutathione S-transferase